MKDRYLNCCLSALFCLMLFACSSGPRTQVTCSFIPHSTVVVEGGGENGSDIILHADSNGCVTHLHGAVPRQVLPRNY